MYLSYLYPIFWRHGRRAYTNVYHMLDSSRYVCLPLVRGKSHVCMPPIKLKQGRQSCWGRLRFVIHRSCVLRRLDAATSLDKPRTEPALAAGHCICRSVGTGRCRTPCGSVCTPGSRPARQTQPDRSHILGNNLGSYMPISYILRSNYRREK